MNAIATIRSNEQGAYADVQDCDRYAELAALMTPDMLVRLRKVVTRYAHGGVDVDDLLQDAIERAMRNWDSYKAGTNLDGLDAHYYPADGHRSVAPARATARPCPSTIRLTPTTATNRRRAGVSTASRTCGGRWPRWRRTCG